MGNILILGETAEQKIDQVTFELLGIGRKLADELNDELYAVLVGHEISQLGEDLNFFGADKVYIIEEQLFKDFQADLWVNVLEKLCIELTPEIFLLGQTQIGIDVGPRLALRLNTSLTTDCMELAVEREKRLLLRTKFVYGGNAIATYAYEKNPQMATVRPKVMKSAERDESRKGEVIPFDIKIDESTLKSKLIKKVEEKEVKLDAAKIIVAGGRGVGSPEGFKNLEGLAGLLGGELGASRPPVDKGWVQKSRQVGLTGIKVFPGLYIAVGISGALQHVQGMVGSEMTVAINNDPKANIFTVSDYGITEKYEEVLPTLLEKIKELKGG